MGLCFGPNSDTDPISLARANTIIIQAQFFGFSADNITKYEGVFHSALKSTNT